MCSVRCSHGPFQLIGGGGVWPNDVHLARRDGEVSERDRPSVVPGGEEFQHRNRYTVCAPAGPQFDVAALKKLAIAGAALQLLGTWLKTRLDGMHIKFKIEQLQPAIKSEIAKRAEEVAHAQVNGGKAYANVLGRSG